MKITLDTDEMSSIGAGLALILQYDPTAAIEPSHDEIYVGGDDSAYSKMTNVEKEIMEEWGWTYEEDMGWHHFT